MALLRQSAGTPPRPRRCEAGGEHGAVLLTASGPQAARAAFWRVLRWWTAIAVAALGMKAFAAQPSPPTAEYQLKAVFLFNFAQFVEWPARAFAAPHAPLVIGVLGADPFGSYLDELVAGEKVGERAI